MAHRTIPKRIDWEGYEHEPIERSNDWYWGLGLVAIVGAIAAIFFNNVLLAIIIVLGAVIMGLYTMTHPIHAQFALTQRGVVVDRQLYPYQNLDSFWIDDMDGNAAAKLLLKSNRTLMPLLVVPLEGVDIEDVHHYLLHYLPEEEEAEPVSHRLFELVGF